MIVREFQTLIIDHFLRVVKFIQTKSDYHLFKKNAKGLVKTRKAGFSFHNLKGVHCPSTGP